MLDFLDGRRRNAKSSIESRWWYRAHCTECGERSMQIAFIAQYEYRTGRPEYLVGNYCKKHGFFVGGYADEKDNSVEALLALGVLIKDKSELAKTDEKNVCSHCGSPLPITGNCEQCGAPR